MDETKTKAVSLPLTIQMMGIFDEIRLEGYQEGFEAGLKEASTKRSQENIKKDREQAKFFSCRHVVKKGFDEGAVASVFEVPRTYVLDLKKQIEKEPLVAQMITSGKMDDIQIAEELEVSQFLVEAVRKDMARQKPL